MRRSIAALCLLSLLISVPTFTATSAKAAGSVGQIITINPATFTKPGKVNTLIPLGDGRLLAGGSFVTIGGQSAPRSLAIIKGDGSLDTTFNIDPDLRVFEVYAAALQSNGKIVISGYFNQQPIGFANTWLIRLNTDGSFDDTFRTTSIFSQVYSILIDGEKIVIGGNFTSHIARLNQDGTADASFSGVGLGPDNPVRGIAWQSSSSKYIIVGDFSTYNGTSRAGLARLNANGSLDTTFAPVGSFGGRQVAVLNDNSILVGSEDICGSDRNIFAWYTAEGAQKPTPAQDPSLLQSITALLPLPDGGFLIGGWYSVGCVQGSPLQHQAQVWRYASDGTYRTFTTFGDDSDVLALALRSPDKVMVGGKGMPVAANQVGMFDGLTLLDLSNNGLAEVSTFKPLVGDEAEIYSLSRYADGSLLVAGDFSHVNASPRFGLTRLLPNGSLDTSFHPFADKPGGYSNAALALPDGRAIAGFVSNKLYLIELNGTLTDLSTFVNHDRVRTLARQSDGKILVGSDFGRGVRRLKANFSGEDTTLQGGDTYGNVYALAVQTDGKILVAGDFTKYHNVNFPGLVRLQNDGVNDGVVDNTFTPPPFMFDEFNTGKLYSVTPLSGGKILVGGDFQTVGGATHPTVVRLSNNGSLDSSFTSPAGVQKVKTICVQGDGSIWIGGTDTSSARNPLVNHLNENGSIDASFQSVYKAAHEGFKAVNAVLCNTGGLNWTGGGFSLIDERPFYGLAKYFLVNSRVYLPLIKR